jgi:hypothetical protein
MNYINLWCQLNNTENLILWPIVSVVNIRNFSNNKRNGGYGDCKCHTFFFRHHHSLGNIGFIEHGGSPRRTNQLIWLLSIDLNIELKWKSMRAWMFFNDGRVHNTTDFFTKVSSRFFIFSQWRNLGKWKNLGVFNQDDIPLFYLKPAV